MVSLVTILHGIADSRTGNARRHDLLEMLTIALVASICGCDSCIDFADFAEDHEALFREFLILEDGLPSHDTFPRLFRLLGPIIPVVGVRVLSGGAGGGRCRYHRH